MVPVSGSGSHIIVNNIEQILVNSKCHNFCYGAKEIWLKKKKTNGFNPATMQWGLCALSFVLEIFSIYTDKTIGGN